MGTDPSSGRRNAPGSGTVAAAGRQEHVSAGSATRIAARTVGWACRAIWDAAGEGAITCAVLSAKQLSDSRACPTASARFPLSPLLHGTDMSDIAPAPSTAAASPGALQTAAVDDAKPLLRPAPPLALNSSATLGASTASNVSPGRGCAARRCFIVAVMTTTHRRQQRGRAALPPARRVVFRRSDCAGPDARAHPQADEARRPLPSIPAG